MNSWDGGSTRLSLRTMAITYSMTKTMACEDLDALVDSIGWGRRRGAWGSCIENSPIVSSAWDDERLVGLARVELDGDGMKVHDVIVHGLYQNRGIGPQVMRNLIDGSRALGVRRLRLLSLGSGTNMYKRLGFYGIDERMQLDL